MIATTLLLDGLGFPEGPRWHDGKLWFSDEVTRRGITVDLQRERRGAVVETVAELPATR